jgi:hypothetical protein
MIKVFVKGIVFGLGVCFSVAAFLAVYMIFFHSSNLHFTSVSNASWHETPVASKVATSSVIVVLKFKHSKNGKLVPFVDEFLKKDNGVDFYYEVGDIYQTLASTFQKYAKEGDKVVMMFTGENAQHMTSMSVTSDKIKSLENSSLSQIKSMVGGNT